MNTSEALDQLQPKKIMINNIESLTFNAIQKRWPCSQQLLMKFEKSLASLKTKGALVMME